MSVRTRRMTRHDAMTQPNDHPDLPPLDELRWEVRQRLTLLETSLLLSGRVNTVALTSRFGISRAQASKDLALYQKLRPHNLVYDRFLKNYVITDRFEPLLVRDTSAEILALLRADLRGEGPLISLAAGMPAVEVLEPVARRIDPQILLPVCRAIYAGEKTPAHLPVPERGRAARDRADPAHPRVQRVPLARARLQ
jgi:hypothetical protein